MKLSELIEYLEQSSNKDLILKINGVAILHDYHITEIKDADFKTVDCGGKKDQWRETIIQLWNPETTSKEKQTMTAQKALSIMNKVNQIQPLNYEGAMKFEYRKGIDETTAVYSIANIHVAENSLIIDLGNIPTQCKAIERSQTTCCDALSCC